MKKFRKFVATNEASCQDRIYSEISHNKQWSWNPIYSKLLDPKFQITGINLRPYSSGDLVEFEGQCVDKIPNSRKTTHIYYICFPVKKDLAYSERAQVRFVGEKGVLVRKSINNCPFVRHILLDPEFAEEQVLKNPGIGKIYAKVLGDGRERLRGHNELGIDFGFFDAKNESIRAMRKSDQKVVDFTETLTHGDMRVRTITGANVGPESFHAAISTPERVYFIFVWGRGHDVDAVGPLPAGFLELSSEEKRRYNEENMDRLKFKLPEYLVDHLQDPDVAEEQIRRNPSLTNSYLKILQPEDREEVRRRLPEAGADFGFFDVKRTNESRERELSGGEKFCREVDAHGAEVTEIRPYDQGPLSPDNFVMTVSIPGEHRSYEIRLRYTWPDLCLNDHGQRTSLTGPNTALKKVTGVKFPMEQVRRNPALLTPFLTILSGHALRRMEELKAEFPEVGADFGFFGATRTNEGKLRNLFRKKKEESLVDSFARDIKSTFKLLKSAVVLKMTSTSTDFSVTYRLGCKTYRFVKMWNGSQRELLEEVVDDHLGRTFIVRKILPSMGVILLSTKFVLDQIRRDPSLGPDYLKIVGDDCREAIKREFPELGADFGFFDTKRSDI